MAKTKTPFLSLGARGSVGESITAQKRPAFTMIREKPLPTDPYSLPQAYQRWLYQDYAYLWTQQDEATKRIHAGAGSAFHLTGFQHWMKYHLKFLPDIVGMWHLDETAGNIAYDSSRNANHATIYGASPVDGLIGGSYSFDGLNDYIKTLGNLIKAPLGALPRTIEGFFRNDQLAAIRYLFCYGPFSEGNICALLAHTIDGPGNLYFGGHTFNWSSGLIMTQEAWHYCCLQIIDSTHVLIQLDETEASGVTPGPLNTLPGPLYIGTRLNIDSWWAGIIDHLFIWDRLLDKTERDRHSARRYLPGFPAIVPPPIALDIGSPAIVRGNTTANTWTFILKDNPANVSTPITSVEVFAWSNLTDYRVGTFYITNGNTLKCRDSALIGNVTAGSKQTFPGLSIACQAGDYIGHYWDAGRIYMSLTGFPGYWYTAGEHIDPGDEATYSLSATRTISLYGTG